MFFKKKFKDAAREANTAEPQTTADEAQMAGATQETPRATEEELVEQYQKHFDKDLAMRLLVKLRKSTRDKPKVIAGVAGAIVTTLGSLISALENPATPLHFRALIVGAIGYILLPLDLIPDITPVIGYADDLASAAGVVAAVGIYSDFSLEKLDAYIDQLDSQA